MKVLTALVCLSLATFAPLGVVAQDEAKITAFSEVAGAYVNVNILKVKQTPMSQQDFCTLLTGTYCPATVGDRLLVPTSAD